MLALPHTNSWGFVYTNQENGSATPGVSVTPGASDAEGSYTEIVGDASVTTAIYYAKLTVHEGRTGTASKQHLLDLAYDPAGGTSYTSVLFSDWACGCSAVTNATSGGTGGQIIHFPCKIPSGSAIAARVQGSNGTAGTVRVEMVLYGKPSRPELWRPAAYSETLGYSSGTLGTSFTPGNAAWGSWASLGTTTKKHFWAQAGIQVDNGTQTISWMHYQVAIGDGTNMHVIIDSTFKSTTNEDNSTDLQFPCTWEIPSGSTLYIRGNNSGAPATGYNATVVLFGG